MKEIIMNLKGGDNAVDIEFKDFLIGCIITTDKEDYENYMKKAYELYFNNDLECVEVPELIDNLCSESIMKEDLLTKVALTIDTDHSNSISGYEFFDFLAKHLGIQHEDWANPMSIKNKLQADFPNIGHSGTFVTES